MLPAEDRRHFGLYGSTLLPARISASAPMASASRIRVPALPGSDVSTATATSRGRGGRETSGIRHTATKPTGVTVSDNAFAALSVTT